MPSSDEEMLLTQTLSAKVLDNSMLSTEEVDSCKRLFRKYSCYKPLSHLLEREFTTQGNTEGIAELLVLLVQKQPNIAKVDVICKDLIISKGLSLAEFLKNFVDPNLKESSHVDYTTILSRIWPYFSPNDQEICLEKICILYEKFIFDQTKIELSYQLLLKHFPQNQKALQYFKNYHLAEENYPEAETLFRKLYAIADATSSPRQGYELAVFLLNYSDKPKEAIELLCKFKDNLGEQALPPLYEAYLRTQDWQGCIDTLKAADAFSKSQELSSVINYRIAERFYSLKKLDDAFLHLQRAKKLDPTLFEVHALEMEILLEEKNWQTIKSRLIDLIEVCGDSKTKSSLESLIERTAAL